jgi:hypothetical protein
MIHFIAFILALTFSGLLLSPDIVAIGQSTISTAAISYIFLPFPVATAVIPVLLAYYFAIFSYRKFSKRQKNTGMKYGASSLIFLALGCYYTNKEYVKPYIHSITIAEIIAPISQTDHTELGSFIGQYFTFQGNDQGIFILNALLERPDLSENHLDKIAKIENKAMHKKLYSRHGLLGQNKKGLSIARLVSHHKNVSPQTLSYLAKMEEPYLLGSVASNPKTPLASLEALYQKSKSISDGYLIQWALARNKSTPTFILRELGLSADKHTKWHAEKTMRLVDSAKHESS